MQDIKLLLQAILYSLVMAPLASFAQIEVTDDLGNQLVLPGPAQRIVSLAPHITETLFAAGAGDKIVATVQFSNYPEAAEQIPRIGGYKEIAYESLLSINPDLVIVWVSGNGEEIIARVRSLGLPVYMDEPRKLEDIPRSISRFGELAGTSDVAEQRAENFRVRLNALKNSARDEPPLRVFYEVWNEPLMTLNGEHLISDIIRMCGGENIFSSAIPLAPVVSTESVLAADPQLIVVSGMDEERPEWLDDWAEWPGLAAADSGQLRFIPPDLLQRSSPRIIEGVEMMCNFVDMARNIEP